MSRDPKQRKLLELTPVAVGVGAFALGLFIFPGQLFAQIALIAIAFALLAGLFALLPNANPSMVWRWQSKRQIWLATFAIFAALVASMAFGN